MNTIEDWLKEKGRKLHFTLIDPDKQDAKKAADLARTCQDYGTDAIMVGGSTINHKITNEITGAIKNKVGIPIIIFPNSANAITEYADYIFFMMLMNSTDRGLLVGEQLKGAVPVMKLGIKTISMGYIVISTSKKPTTVERVSSLDTIASDDIKKVVDYALVAQYFGMSCVYLEAGSGAEKPVSNEMISAVKAVLDIPIIVGGGIRDGKTAREKMDAGADVIVTGTIAEEKPEKIQGIINEID